MKDLEFYSFENELWCMYPDGTNRVVTESDTELVRSILDRIRECYPDAYKALESVYRKSAMSVPYYQYLMVRRFCKCNFGNLDSREKDVDKCGMFRFETVTCPLRGECQHEGVICGAKFNTNLSKSEMRVMALLYRGMSYEEIASQIYISPETVRCHVKSSYRKLGIHDKFAFMEYARTNNLFNEENV